MTTKEFEIRNSVEKVFRDIFEDAELVVSKRTTAADIPTWDSLTHISLILALEEEFGIEFTSLEVTSMSCVGDLYVLLEEKLDGRVR